MKVTIVYYYSLSWAYDKKIDKVFRTEYDAREYCKLKNSNKRNKIRHFTTKEVKF